NQFDLPGIANPRLSDNLVSYPRATDTAITVFDGAPSTTPHNLWGADNTPDTPDDAVFAGDILVAKYTGDLFGYLHPITGVSTSSSSTVFIRTDRCDFVTGGTVTE